MLKKNMLVGAVVGAMSCGAMVADTVGFWDLAFVGIQGTSVRASWTDGVSSGTFRGTAGKITMRSLDNEGLYPAGETFQTFCADIGVPLADAWTYLAVDPIAEGVNGVMPKWRDGGWLAASHLVDVGTTYGSDAKMAGLQLALWEVLYDSNYNLAAGNFKVTEAGAATLNYAQQYLNLAATMPVGYDDSATYIMPVTPNNGAINGPVPAQSTEDRDYTIGGSQGLIVLVPDGGVTLLLLGLGFGGLSLIQRRARRA